MGERDREDQPEAFGRLERRGLAGDVRARYERARAVPAAVPDLPLPAPPVQRAVTSDEPETPSADSSAASGGAAAGAPDAKAIADKVYDLMREELRRARERGGPTHRPFGR